MSFQMHAGLARHPLPQLRLVDDHLGQHVRGKHVGFQTDFSDPFADRLAQDIQVDPAIADVLGNHIQVNASAKSVLLPLITAGKLRGLRHQHEPNRGRETVEPAFVQRRHVG